MVAAAVVSQAQPLDHGPRREVRPAPVPHPVRYFQNPGSGADSG